MSQVKITFNVSGRVDQVVEITDSKYTPARLVKELNSGKLLASIQETGEVLKSDTLKPVARVVSVDNECSYEEFSVKE